MPDTWEAWHPRAQVQFQLLVDMGLAPARCIVQPQAFAGWCASRGASPDQKARNAYCIEVLAAAKMGRSIS